jgi:hypothetical protein
MLSKLLNLDLFRNTSLVKEPFPYLVIPGFLNKDKLAKIHDDYPAVPGAGSYPLDLFQYGAAFDELITELQGTAFRQVICEKFNINLEGRPTLITVRGHSQERDGQIHTDTKSKIITVLLYMNPSWEQPGGQLRLLKNGNNIDDVITEIPPVEGTLLVFKVSHNSWHGHKPFIGDRRVIQMNYVLDENVIKKEIARHHFSARVKKLKSMIGLGSFGSSY